MAIFGLKLAILDFKMAMELSKNIFIWTTAKSCTREYGIIHFITFFITFMWLRCQKGLKMAILGLKMALLDFKMGVELSKNILIWTTVKSCTKDYGINHFIIFFITFLWLKSQKSLKWLFLAWKWPFWISKWPWSSPKIVLSERQRKFALGSMVSSILLTFLITFIWLKCQKGLKWLFLAWKWSFWISKWPWSSPKIFSSERHLKVILLSRVSSSSTIVSGSITHCRWQCLPPWRLTEENQVFPQ